MSNFKFGGSPSTPNRKGKGSFFSQGPSTTPAGPPPTYLTDVSTTPAGDPPRSSRIFGSSFNPAGNTFGHRATPGRKGRTAFQVPESSPPRFDEGDDEDAPGELLSPARHDFIASTIESSPRGFKRSRNGQIRDSSGMPDIARALVRDAGPAQTIEEPDDVVLGTEQFLSELDVALHHQERATLSREDNLTDTVAHLSGLWEQHCDDKTLPGAVGPELDDALTKASYLSSLILQLHHPHTTRPVQPQERTGRSLQSQRHSRSIPLPRALLDWLNAHHNPLPDEFNDVHLCRPSPSAHEAFWDILGADIIRGRFQRVVRLLRDAGWENAASAAADYEDDRAQGYRGRHRDNIEEVIERCIGVIEVCPAVTNDNWDVPGPEWTVFRQRVRHALRDLETFATDPDEQTSASSHPDIFAASTASMAAATARAEIRVPQTVYQSLKMLYGVLLGSNGILDYAQDWVEASILLTVWWDGEESAAALDASVAELAASRNGLRKSARGRGSTREVDIAPLPAYRRRLGDMFSIVPSEIPEPTFQPDSLDPVHVGLATVFEDEVSVTIGILRTWSQTIAGAVVEIGALGGWLPISEGRPNSRGLLGRGFSSEDLMVLSHGPKPVQLGGGDAGIDRDDVLNTYAELLAGKEKFVTSDGKVEREGWELAVSVLSRLEDGESAQARIRDVLEAMEVHDETRVQKVLTICADMGLGELSRGIAERYADGLSTQVPVPYGSALIYYARAHVSAKIRDTLALLISTSLLQSAATPPQQTLDSNLASLLSKDRTALVHLAEADPEAAELLARGISGYAMLRHFYSIRDGHSKSSNNIARQREAAKTLLAVIESASDCIKGGLFDSEIESAVPVEGLLVLLGEVLPLLGQTAQSGKPQRTFETKQLTTLMAVIEDFEQVSGRIREGGEGLLHASMNCYKGSNLDTSSTLKKSISSISASGVLSGSGSDGWEKLAESSWSLLQSAESLQSQQDGKKMKGKSRMQILDIKRGWDWRKGVDAVSAGGVEVGSAEVVMLVRTALAREMGRAWGGGWS